MREILFRGKRVDNGEWVEGGFCYGSNRKESLICPQYDFSQEVLPETVGQYTGLTDKNDKKIFEGDIVKYSDKELYLAGDPTEFIGNIVFENGAFGIGSREELPIDLDYWCDNDNFVSLWELYWNLNFTQGELSRIEVIGNIHDNPELLEEI